MSTNLTPVSAHLPATIPVPQNTEPADAPSLTQFVIPISGAVQYWQEFLIKYFETPTPSTLHSSGPYPISINGIVLNPDSTVETINDFDCGGLLTGGRRIEFTTIVTAGTQVFVADDRTVIFNASGLGAGVIWQWADAGGLLPVGARIGFRNPTAGGPVALKYPSGISAGNLQYVSGAMWGANFVKGPGGAWVRTEEFYLP